MTVLKAAVLLLLLSCLPLRAQDKPAVVKLTVKHDGQKKPAPASVTLRFGNHSVEVAVREDKFEVPPDIGESGEGYFRRGCRRRSHRDPWYCRWIL